MNRMTESLPPVNPADGKFSLDVCIVLNDGTYHSGRFKYGVGWNISGTKKQFKTDVFGWASWPELQFDHPLNVKD